MKFKEMLEAVNDIENMDMAKKFVKNVEKEFKKHFPNGWFDGEVSRMIGDWTISLEFGIGNYTNGIKVNDDMNHSVIIAQPDFVRIRDFASDDFYFNIVHSGLKVKPDPDSYLAFKRIKTKLTQVKKGGSLAKFEKKMKSWFPKLKKLVKEHQDNFHTPLDKKHKV